MVIRTNFILLLFCGACAQNGLDDLADEPNTLDANFFRCQVQPLITKSCAFMDCHGNEDRPLRIFAEQRFRMNKSWIDYEDPIEEDELHANLRTMAGFVEGAASGTSLLTEKPLDARFGGRYHRGRDLYGVDDAFLSREDVDYQTLRSFAQGATDSADCVPGEGATP